MPSSVTTKYKWVSSFLYATSLPRLRFFLGLPVNVAATRCRDPQTSPLLKTRSDCCGVYLRRTVIGLLAANPDGQVMGEIL